MPVNGCYFVSCRRLMAVNSVLAKITIPKTCQFDAPNRKIAATSLPEKLLNSELEMKSLAASIFLGILKGLTVFKMLGF